MQAGDPRADPAVVDLIELAGLWLGAGDWAALGRTLRRLDAELTGRFGHETEFGQRFRDLQALVERQDEPAAAADEIRRAYRRAIVG